jgi:hypothetical protein
MEVSIGRRFAGDAGMAEAGEIDMRQQRASHLQLNASYTICP